MKRALVTGNTGQEGSYLAEMLLQNLVVMDISSACAPELQRVHCQAGRDWNTLCPIES
jgi:GDP-D-mannose dehydratase